MLEVNYNICGESEQESVAAKARSCRGFGMTALICGGKSPIKAVMLNEPAGEVKHPLNG